MTGRLNKASIQVFWMKFCFKKIFREMTCDNKRKVDSENWRQPDPRASRKEQTSFQKKKKKIQDKILKSR